MASLTPGSVAQLNDGVVGLTPTVQVRARARTRSRESTEGPSL